MSEPSAPPPPYSADDGFETSKTTDQDELSLTGINEVLVGLSWDVDSKDDIDLDASCVLFDEDGQYIEAIYFGNLTNSSKSVTHTGDNRSGEGEGFDEEICIDFRKLPSNTFALAICVNSYSGHNFDEVKSAKVSLLQVEGRKETKLNDLTLNACGGHTGIIIAKMYKQKGIIEHFVYQKIGKFCKGRSFGDMLPLIQYDLRAQLPKIKIIPKPDVVVLTKGESVDLESLCEGVKLDKICMGLGWDMLGNQAVDLDASCCSFDQKNNNVENVFYQNLTSRNGTIRHAGDNLTGAGDGDDEKIYVDLSRVDYRTSSLFFVVNSYSNHSFDRIKNAYVRLVNRDTGLEVLRFQLSGVGNKSTTAMLMCKLFRDGKGWKLKALGYGTQGKMCTSNIKDMTKELAGRLKLNEGVGFKFVPGQKNTNGYGTGAMKSKTSWDNVFIILLVLFFVWYFFFSGGSTNDRAGYDRSPYRGRR